MLCLFLFCSLLHPKANFSVIARFLIWRIPGSIFKFVVLMPLHYDCFICRFVSVHECLVEGSLSSLDGLWHTEILVCRYHTNQTSTTKYSWFSFLPRSLFEQYRRAAYWYFTAMAALSLLPFSPYNPISVWLPLAFVLTLGIVRELWEDLRRRRGDREVNNRPILVHTRNGRLEEKRWKLLHVGDVVKVLDGDYFPADLLLLSSTGPEGVCYVETMNLDGETNLKVLHFFVPCL